MAEDETQESGRLARWSQRKRGVVREDEPVVLSPEEVQAQKDVREAELAANREAAEEIDLDTIDADSDLSLFMKEGVPPALKKAALAKLWRSDPVFANVDGLVEYGENYADPSLIMKTFTSAYQVGKGYLKEVLEEDEEVAVAEAQSANVERNGEAAEEITGDEPAETQVSADVSEDANAADDGPGPELGLAEFELADAPLEEPVEAPVAKVSLRQRMGV